VVAVRLDDTCAAERAPQPPYLLVDRPDLLPAVLAALEQTDRIALDVETTGLDPRADRVRLLSLALDTSDSGTFAYLVDCTACDPRPVLDALAGKELVAHHAAFDLGFLARMGFTPTAAAHCTQDATRVLYAGESASHKLQDCLRRELGVEVSKEQQKSDWSGRLSREQLDYAARDVLHLRGLFEALREKITAAGMAEVLAVEERCLPALVWMAGSGVGFDAAGWAALVDGTQKALPALTAELNRLAPLRDGEFVPGWKWASPKDVKEVFGLLGFQVEDTEAETLALIDHPIVGPYLAFKEAAKRAGGFGRSWLKAARDGRLYPGWNQTGAMTGRMSAKEPNVQQTPREAAYRRCFVAPPGRVLVKADYSQLELRVAAKIAGEANMLAAYRRGEDLHALTARRLTGSDDVTARQRQLAKPVNFGLIYGLSAKSLRTKARAEYGVDLSEADARRYCAAFFAAYPAIRSWHRQLRGSRSTETRTVLGRRVLVKPELFHGARANYAVQGTGGDGVKIALALLWERRHEVSGAFPVLAVHDEIVVECNQEQAEAVTAWLKQAMVDAMAPLIDPVPVEVEVKVGRTWGG
jgi:DNA polymerase-1